MNTTNELDQLTAPPWRWKFVGNAGNYFLLGNDGNGPITNSGPDSADGRLKQSAPTLLALLTEGLGIYPGYTFADDLEAIAEILDDYHLAIASNLKDKAQAIRAAVAEAKGSDTPPRGQQG